MTLKETILNAVASATLLAAGSTVVGLKINDSRQDDKIVQLQQLSGDVNGLRSDVNRLDKHLSVIDGRFQGEADGPRK